MTGYRQRLPIAEISAASQEQSSGIDQVNKAITQMDEVTQQNAAMAEEMAASRKSLEEQAATLRELVGFFRLEGRTARRHGGAAALDSKGGPGASGFRGAVLGQGSEAHT